MLCVQYSLWHFLTTFSPNFPLAVLVLVIASQFVTVLYALTIYSFSKLNLIEYLVRAQRFTEGTRYATFVYSELTYLAKQLGTQFKIVGLNFLSPLGEPDWGSLRPNRCVTSLRFLINSDFNLKRLKSELILPQPQRKDCFLHFAHNLFFRFDASK